MIISCSWEIKESNLVNTEKKKFKRLKVTEVDPRHVFTIVLSFLGFHFHFFH